MYHPLLRPEVVLDGDRLLLQRVDHQPEPLDLRPLAGLLAPEREQIGRGVLAALDPEVEQEGERRERGPAGRGHSG